MPPPGDVAIALTDERGLDVPVTTTDMKDNTFRIDFEPKTVGLYTCSVFFADQEIPTSPYKINVLPSIDIGKVRVEGLEESEYQGFFSRNLILELFFRLKALSFSAGMFHVLK